MFVNFYGRFRKRDDAPYPNRTKTKRGEFENADRKKGGHCGHRFGQYDAAGGA
jgi:hypothetical protein